ncbi:MAG: S1 RNA-binding domain-containing protein [Ignavibacteria bacterium]|nr:S1 RNA-binding domain-containing protein [Ignavibacteria bacterium]
MSEQPIEDATNIPSEPAADASTPNVEHIQHVEVTGEQSTDATEIASSDAVSNANEESAHPEAAVAQEPVAEAAATPALSEEEKAEQAAKREEERKHKEEERKRRDEAYSKLEGFHNSKGSFDVVVIERVKGGLRGDFEGLRIFLPASHVGLRKNAPEDDLNELLGKTVTVKVHELQSDDTGYKSAVVTRRDILLDEYWGKVEVGTVHEGIVSSVTAFGAFVNIGGIEGLVHVSRLSKSRIDNPASVVKKGDKITVTVAEVDREKRKLALSHKEHEADPWVGVAEAFPAGKRVKGVVRRITDFGAYVQVAPKIEGLLRISELSWTRRIKHPSEVVAVGQELDLEVLSTNQEKHQLSLGYKQTLENPWLDLATTLPVGSDVTGVVQQASTQGAVVRVNDTFDGFMPRSKMLNAGRGAKVQINVGDTIHCVVADLNGASASLILAMKGEDGSIGGQQEDVGGSHGHRDGGRERSDAHRSHQPIPSDPGVTLGDLLKDAQKSMLQK